MDLLWNELEKNAKFFDEDEKDLVHKILDEYFFEEYLYDEEVDEETSIEKLEELAYTINASLYSLDILISGRKTPMLIYNLSKKVDNIGNYELRRLKIRTAKRLKSLDKSISVDIDYLDLNEFNDVNFLGKKPIKTVNDLHSALVEYLYFTDLKYMQRTLNPKIIKIVMLDDNDEKFRLIDGEYAGISAYRSSYDGEFPYNDYILISVDENFDFVGDMSFLIPHEYGHKLFLTHVEELIYFIDDCENYTDEEYSMISYLLHKRPTIMSDLIEFGSSKHFNFIDRVKLHSIKELYEVAREAIDL